MGGPFFRIITGCAACVVIVAGGIYIFDKAGFDIDRNREEEPPVSAIFTVPPKETSIVDVCHDAVYEQTKDGGLAIWDWQGDAQVEAKPDGASIVRGQVSYKDAKTGIIRNNTLYHCLIGPDGSVASVNITRI